MRSQIIFCCIFLFNLFCSHAYCQKYKTASDTPAINKEYQKVSLQVTELKKQLGDANAKLPDEQSKIAQTNLAEQTAVLNSKNEANAANSGNLHELKKAEREAKRAKNKQEDVLNAQKKANNEVKDIQSLSSKLDRKQKRLKELEDERTSILSSIPPNSK